MISFLNIELVRLPNWFHFDTQREEVSLVSTCNLQRRIQRCSATDRNIALNKHATFRYPKSTLKQLCLNELFHRHGGICVHWMILVFPLICFMIILILSSPSLLLLLSSFRHWNRSVEFCELTTVSMDWKFVFSLICQYRSWAKRLLEEMNWEITSVSVFLIVSECKHS